MYENNDKKPRKPSWDAVVLAEYRLLNSIVHHPEFLNNPQVNEDIFQSETAKSLFVAIRDLVDNNFTITPASLLQKGGEIDFTITQQVVSTVFGIDTDETVSLDTILPTLKTAQLKNTLLSRLDEIKLKVNNPGSVDSDTILANLYELDIILQKNGEPDSPLLSFDAWSDRYLQDLEERKAGRKYTYGDILLDGALRKGAYPGAITTIAASTSMGKSTYVLHLVNNFLERDVPCMYLSLEMGAVDTFDRLIAMRCGIDNEALYNLDADNINEIIEKVKREKENLKNRERFYFSEATDVDIHKLRPLIREFKQKSHSDYAVVAIDLVTQMKNFMSAKNGSSTATAMEIGMNDLNALAKEENVHIIAVAQFRRDSDSMKIHSVEEIDYLRPTLGDIKNSGALAERSRVVMSIFRPKYYADRYLQNSDEAQEMDDIMEVQILKNSNGGSAGKTMKYTFDNQHFRLLPIINEEKEDKMDKLKELSIDF